MLNEAYKCAREDLFPTVYGVVYTNRYVRVDEYLPEDIESIILKVTHRITVNNDVGWTHKKQPTCA